MKTVLSLFLTLFVSVSLLQAGVVYEIEVQNHEQSTSQIESVEMAAQGSRLKMGIGSGGMSRNQNAIQGRGSSRGGMGPGGGPSGSMYYDNELKKVVIVDGMEGFSIDQDSFSQMPMAAPQAPSSGIAAPPGVPAGVWNMLPEAQKAEILKQMQKSGQSMPQGNPYGQPAEETVRFVDTRKTGTTSDGKRYRIWRKLVNNQLAGEYKVVDWKDVPEGVLVRDLMIGFASFMSDIQKSAMGQNFRSPSDSMFNDMEQVNGFPYEGTEFENNRKVSTFRVTKMTKKNLSDKELQPDPRIQIQDMGALMGQAAAGMGDLFNQMGQGNPYSGSDIDREAMLRMQQQRQNSQRGNTRGGAASSSAVANEAADAPND